MSEKLSILQKHFQCKKKKTTTRKVSYTEFKSIKYEGIVIFKGVKCMKEGGSNNNKNVFCCAVPEWLLMNPQIYVF